MYLSDLKKTLAVLLDNILLRLGKLESKVDVVIFNATGNLTNGTAAVATASSTGNADKVNVAGGWHWGGTREPVGRRPMDCFGGTSGHVLETVT